MAAFDLLTSADLAPLAAKLDAVLEALAQGTAAAAGYLTKEQVAAFCGVERRTVTAWHAEGRHNAQGKRIYLPAYELGAGLLRFRRADVDAWAEGRGTPRATLPAVRPAKAERPAAANPLKQRAEPAPPLRLAS